MLPTDVFCQVLLAYQVEYTELVRKSILLHKGCVREEPFHIRNLSHTNE